MITERGLLRWIDTFGGSHLLLSSELFEQWQGVFTEFDRYGYDWPYSDPPPAQETDYDRACAIEGYLGQVSVGDGYGLVLGDMPMDTAWYPFSTTEGILIRWVYGEDAASLLQRLLPIDERVWAPDGASIHVSEHPLYLSDSSSAGEPETERLTITLAAGEYEIDTAIVEPDTHTQMVVHRLRRMISRCPGPLSLRAPARPPADPCSRADEARAGATARAGAGARRRAAPDVRLFPLVEVADMVDAMAVFDEDCAGEDRVGAWPSWCVAEWVRG